MPDIQRQRFWFHAAAVVLVPTALDVLYIVFSRWPIDWSTPATDASCWVLSVAVGVFLTYRLSFRPRWVWCAVAAGSLAAYLFLFNLVIGCTAFDQCL